MEGEEDVVNLLLTFLFIHNIYTTNVSHRVSLSLSLSLSCVVRYIPEVGR